MSKNNCCEVIEFQRMIENI